VPAAPSWCGQTPSFYTAEVVAACRLRPRVLLAEHRKHQHVEGRLIVRRVLRENTETAQGQGELFAVYRYHPVSPTTRHRW
jgi:hypothetical protein